MADEAKKTPTWGYSKNDAKIFELADGEKLPKGYYDSPAAVPGAEADKADAKAQQDTEAK